MKRAVLVVVLLFLVAGAAGFPASLELVERSASPDDPALFEVKITNNLSAEKTFRATASGPNPSWFYVGGAEKLAPGETGSIPVEITPDEDAIQQNYYFQVFVNTVGSNEYVQLSDYYSVRRPFDLQIFSHDLSPGRADPGETVTLTVSVRNLASETVSDYRVEAEYFNNTEIRQSSPMIPGGERRFGFEIEIPENTSPRQETVGIEVYRGEDLQQSVEETFEVADFRRINRSETLDDRILIQLGELVVENTGNAPANTTVNRTMPSYLAPITVFTPAPDQVLSAQNSNTYVWSTALEPGESFSVQYRLDYWMPVLLLALLVAGIVALKKLRRNVRFVKRVEKTDEGVNVYLELTNLSDTFFHELEVEDFVPDVAEVMEEFETARPVIRKTSDGTRLSWTIDELSPGDQRVYQYTIKPKIEVEGGITLQEAVLKEEGETFAGTDKVDSEFKPE